MKFLSFVVALICASKALAFAPSSIAKRGAVSTKNFAPLPKASQAVAPLSAASDAEFYIDEERRFVMNVVWLGAFTLTIAAIGVPFIAFLYPPGAGGGSGGVSAKDALGNDIVAKDYLESKPAGDRSLAQGLKGDATYLIVKEDKTLESYGLNAVCTHLGCVVPWSAPNNKFMCPCHGSQYSPDGAVVRGPAPLPLALAHCDVNDKGVIAFSTWSEDDFRTGSKGWWM